MPAQLGRQHRREGAEGGGEHGPGEVGEEHDRPYPRHLPQVGEPEVGHHGQDGGDRAFGEELLPGQDDHDEADRVTGAIRTKAVPGSPTIPRGRSLSLTAAPVTISTYNT